MIRPILGLYLALTILIVVGCQTKIDVEKENARLLETDIEFSRKSVEVGAAEAFNMYLADSAIQLPAGGEPVMGRESIYAAMKDGHSVLQWEPKKAEVSASGDLGYTWGTYTITTENEKGQKKTSYGKYLDVWKKQSDGSWKVLIDIGNQSPEPQGESHQ
jgi:ketosteroid isomerase-like protein